MRLFRAPLYLTLLGTLAFSACGGDDETTNSNRIGPAPAPQPITTRLALRNDMRAQMTASAASTRMLMMSALHDLPDGVQASQFGRERQTRLARTLRPFVSQVEWMDLEARMEEDARLTHAHLVAIKRGDQNGITASRTALQNNTDALAGILSRTSLGLDEATLRQQMRDDITQLETQANARLQNDFDGDIRAFDSQISGRERLADDISTGIADRFPEMVPTVDIAEDELAARSSLRARFQDQAIWTRMTMVSSIGRLGDGAATRNRFLQSQRDVGQTVRPFFGDDATSRFTGLLEDQANGTTEFIDASIAGDPSQIDASTARLQANADLLTNFLSGTDGQFDANTFRTGLDAQITGTIDQTNARLRGNFDDDFRSFDTSLSGSLDRADTFGDGLFSPGESL